MARNSRIVLLGAAVLAACALVALLLMEDRGEIDLATTAPAVPTAADSEALAAPLASRPPAPTVALVESIAAPTSSAEAPAVTSDRSHPACSVFGQVTDASGAPLSNVDVSLGSVGEPWIAGDSTQSSEASDDYKTQTDTDGKFRFECPLPTSSWISLYIEPGIFHGITGRDFGSAGGRRQDPLRAGDNDLGIFVLESRGAIEGLVLGVDGNGIARAIVSLARHYPGDYTINEFADEKGHYVLGGVPAGVWSFAAERDGYLDVQRTGIEVITGKTTPGVDFRMAHAPFLEGRVVDTSGRPLVGVDLQAWSLKAGSSARTSSGVGGRFHVSLPHDVPYSIAAELAGYERVEDGVWIHYPQGTSDIEIVLKPQPRETFLVQSAAGGQPLETFGLVIVRRRDDSGNPINQVEGDPELRHHPGGLTTATADAALDGFQIFAPGHARLLADELPVPNSEGRRVIVLQAEGAIVGRLGSDDHFLASPIVQVAAHRFPVPMSDPPTDEELRWGPFFDTDVDDFCGGSRSSSGNADGSFRIGGLSTGTYSLTLKAPGTAPITLDMLRVTSGNTLDVGDIALVPPGELRGTITLAEGYTVGGLQIGLGPSWHWAEESAHSVGPNGRFRFDQLGAGKHILWVGEQPGTIVNAGPFEFELAVGEQRDVMLDLSPYIPCRVAVAVRVNGKPASGFAVQYQSANAEPDQWQHLGMTGEDGTVFAWLGAGLEVFFQTSAGWSTRTIGPRVGPVGLPLGGKRDVTMDIATGDLLVTLPRGVDLESSWWATAKFQWLEAPDSPSWFENLDDSTRWVEDADTKERQFELGPLDPGRWSVQLGVNSSEGTKVFSAEATVVPGGRTVVQLEPVP